MKFKQLTMLWQKYSKIVLQNLHAQVVSSILDCLGGIHAKWLTYGDRFRSLEDSPNK
ncbi:hypothetical protein [Desulfobacula sp.]|uniref:hypothetical protein n=1 Tax=Desulfobacula sp. TaxID=2593537 RepID=UPI001DB91913|nr:hypothetical protein [Desulfobacula sp.]MBT3487954.1 hypothetical protein [Desulfobacula sp.]MBT4201416.1 hypothetical protein [Desulfobacula sp.]MBT4509175.1 hypothetical protein [Desulfobacula sp.]MBT6751888.1 hypothetical protein [Desulfobacula sp.]